MTPLAKHDVVKVRMLVALLQMADAEVEALARMMGQDRRRHRNAKTWAASVEQMARLHVLTVTGRRALVKLARTDPSKMYRKRREATEPAATALTPSD